MSLRTGLLLGVVALLALGLYLAEWVEREENAGPSMEALLNPYMAADRFLEQLDRPVERHTERERLGTQALDTVLVIERSGPLLSEEVLDAVLAWVDEGGHLLLQADASWREGEPGAELLGRVGVELHDGESSLADEVDDEVDNAEFAEELFGALLPDYCPSSGLTDAIIDGSRLVLAMPKSRQLIVDDAWLLNSAGNRAGVQFAEVRYGYGSVAVMTSFDPWRNTRIDCYDHAHVLRLLTRGAARVEWFASTAMPPLWKMLWERFSLALVLFALALLIWCWHHSVRFGRPKAVLEEPRREVLEHLEGNARFLWQQHERDALLTALRQRPRALSERLGVPALAEAAGIPENLVVQALAERAVRRTDEFRDLVRVLVRLNRFRPPGGRQAP